MKWSPEDWARLGETMRRDREAQGMSRRSLSGISGVSEKSIQLTEEGRVPTRWPRSLSFLEDALGWTEGAARIVLDGGELLKDRHVRDERERRKRKRDGREQDLLASYLAGAAESTSSGWQWYLEKYGVHEEELPDDVAVLVPLLGHFATRCAGSDVPTRLITAFQGMAAIMLQLVAAKHQERIQKLAAQTPEEAEVEAVAKKRKIREDAEALKRVILERLELERSAPPDAADRDLNIRALERGIQELQEIIEW